MEQQIHWKLTVKDESKPSFIVMLACGDKAVIGRSRTCDIILSDLSVSRKHCFFGVGEDGVLKLVDLGAHHPTLLNEVIVKAGCAVPVQDGCQVRLGRRSFIKVECEGEALSNREVHVEPVGDDELEHTCTGGPEESVPVEIVEVDPGEDERNLPKDKLDKKSQVKAPQHTIAKPASESGQQDETHLVDSKECSKQLPPDQLIPPKRDEGNLILQEGRLVGDDIRDLKVDAEKKTNQVNALKESVVKKVNRSVPQEDVTHTHTEVLGKTLQGKLILPKKNKPDPVLNNTVRGGSDAELLTGDEAIITSRPDGDAQDETSSVDPAKTQMLMRDQNGSCGKKRGKKGAAGKGDESGNTAPSEDGSQDETNFIDPAELQRLMQGKAKKGKKGSVSRGPARKGGESGHTVPSEGDSQDETNFIDPAELKRLLQGKAKKGKKGAVSRGIARKGDVPGNTVPGEGASQDETNFIDPAELQKLIHGKAGLFGKKAGKKGLAPQKHSRKGAESRNIAPSDSGAQDETNFIDPAELKKLMKNKAGLFSKKRGKNGAAAMGPAQAGNEVEKTGSDESDSQDETSYIDPAELQKLIKGKAKSPRSSKGRLR